MVIRRKKRPGAKPADLDAVKLPVLRPIILVIFILLAVFTGCIFGSRNAESTTTSATGSRGPNCSFVKVEWTTADCCGAS